MSEKNFAWNDIILPMMLKYWVEPAVTFNEAQYRWEVPCGGKTYYFLGVLGLTRREVLEEVYRRERLPCTTTE